MNWLLEEEFQGLPEDIFDDIEDDDVTTNGEVGDWEAKFKHLDTPPIDVITSFPSLFTSSRRINNKVSPVETVPADMKQSSDCAALSGINSTLHQSDIKVSKLFQSLSPVSVLESSNGSSWPQNSRLAFPMKGMRSKRKRPTTLRFKYLHQLKPTKPEKLTPGESGYNTYYDFEQHAKKRRKRNSDGMVKKCSHCETTETPQWREGPSGPKTLCNACGVRFRSGRLVPEYRPASSPSFIPSVHSNSHKKIIEMRRKEGGHFNTSMIHGVVYGA